MQKTNAMRILDKSKIKYSTYCYDCKDGVIDGLSVAEKLNQDPNRVFKTLVTVGSRKNYYVFVLPVNEELDLKKGAKIIGEKKIEMIHVKDINKITGYIRGGCSPIGMKKQYITVIHETARDFDSIIFSGGKLGFQIEMSVQDLIELISAKVENIIV